MRTITPLLLFLSSAVSAQGTITAELLSDPFVENYDPEVSVSGNVVVGIMATTAAQAIVDDQVELLAAGATGKQKLCLKAASRDGIYTSRNVYALPDGASGKIRLPYLSTHEHVISDFGEHEIALSATAGDCESGASDYYLVRGMESAEAGTAVIYLNSFGATDVFVELGDSINSCEYITEGRRTAFDFICPLELDEAEGAIPVTILRERFGREQPPVALRLIGVSP